MDQPRRTHAERRAVTRANITAAALEELAANGYAEMTIADVAARAGVSRGATLHYFAAKTDLALGAIEDGIVSCLRDLRAALDAAAGAADFDAAVLDALHDVFAGRLYQAYLAVQVHGRGDAELRTRLEAVATRSATELIDTATAAWTASIGDVPTLRTFVLVVTAFLRGLARTGAGDNVRCEFDPDTWSAARALFLRELAAMRASYGR